MTTGLNTKTQAILDDLPTLLTTTNDKLDTVHDDNILVIAAINALSGYLSDIYTTLAGLSTGLAANLPFNDTGGGLFALVNDIAGKNDGMLDRLQAIQDALTLTDGDLLSAITALVVADESTALNTRLIGRNQQTLIICCDSNPALPIGPDEPIIPDDICQRAGWAMNFIRNALSGLIYLMQHGVINTTMIGQALSQYGAQFTPAIIYSSSTYSELVGALLDAIDSPSALLDDFDSIFEEARLAIGVTTTSQDAKAAFQSVVNGSNIGNFSKAVFLALGNDELFTYIFEGTFDNQVSAYPNDCVTYTYGDPVIVSTGSSRTTVWDTQGEVEVYQPAHWRGDWGSAEGATNEEPGTSYLAFHTPYIPPGSVVASNIYLITDAYQWQFKIEADTYGQQVFIDGLFFADCTTNWQSIPVHTMYITVEDSADDGSIKPSWSVSFRQPV